VSDQNPPGHTDDGIDETLPDVVKDFLRSGADLEEIRLDERGRWTHEGLDFENPRIIRLFNRSVDRTEGGTWILEVGRFTYPITVEDCGFFVERVDFDNEPPTLYLSDQTKEPLEADTLRYEGDGKLYCSVKDGEFRARFKWDAYYGLAQRLVEQDGKVCLEWNEKQVSLGSLDEME
jgi:hypothetical protein